MAIPAYNPLLVLSALQNPSLLARIGIQTGTTSNGNQFIAEDGTGLNGRPTRFVTSWNEDHSDSHIVGYDKETGKITEQDFQPVQLDNSGNAINSRNGAIAGTAQQINSQFAGTLGSETTNTQPQASPVSGWSENTLWNGKPTKFTLTTDGSNTFLNAYDPQTNALLLTEDRNGNFLDGSGNILLSHATAMKQVDDYYAKVFQS